MEGRACHKFVRIKKFKRAKYEKSLTLHVKSVEIPSQKNDVYGKVKKMVSSNLKKEGIVLTKVFWKILLVDFQTSVI